MNNFDLLSSETIEFIFNELNLLNQFKSKMNHFDLLPPETIEFIFKKVNLDDLNNLGIVDERFKKICDQIKIKQLCVSDKLNYTDYSLFWFYTNQPTYLSKENVIKFSNFPNYATIFQLDKHLKRLSLDIDNFNFSILNQFKLLEQLSVKTNKLIGNNKLSLDHLKIVDFYLQDGYNSEFKLIFDTNKLFAFKLESVGELVFKYPKRIIFFEIDFNVDWNLLYDYYLKNFNNLQYLKINNLETGSLGRYILSQLKNLKILDLHIGRSFRENDDLIEDIKFLINEKENSVRRSKLEIYLNGVKLIDQNKINQLKWFDEEEKLNCDLFEFQIENYDLLKDNCDTTVINYCDLIKLIKIIPSSFTNKFPFIHEVKANDRIDNEDQFIKFLNNLQHLSGLVLINCELTKSFYDQLIDSVYLKDLKDLIIEEKQDLEMNFDFILQLKQLEEFQTNQIIANHIDLIYKLFKQNDLMHWSVFKFDLKNCVEIYKWDSGIFNIVSYYLDDNLKEIKNFSIDALNLDEVILRLKD